MGARCALVCGGIVGMVWVWVCHTILVEQADR